MTKNGRLRRGTDGTTAGKRFAVQGIISSTPSRVKNAACNRHAKWRLLAKSFSGFRSGLIFDHSRETGRKSVRLSIIANPWAGRGRGQALIESFRHDARADGLATRIETTGQPGDGAVLARRLREDSDVIGIIGGDGTVHEVVNGLMPDPLPIVILPVGTGNDFASLMRCPTGFGEMADLIERGYGARFDVLEFPDRFCVNSAGMGFEGLVNRRSHRIRWARGSLLYLIAVFETLASLECPPFSIVTPDGTRLDGRRLLVSIGNGNRTGGAFYLTPEAMPDDGLIDVCVVDAMRWPRVLRLLPKSFSGGHVASPGVEMLRVPSLTIETSPEFPMHIDGELVESAPARMTITTRHRTLPVLCGERQKNPLKHRLEKLL